jgi:hypothetical protein
MDPNQLRIRLFKALLILGFQVLLHCVSEETIDLLVGKERLLPITKIELVYRLKVVEEASDALLVENLCRIECFIVDEDGYAVVLEKFFLKFLPLSVGFRVDATVAYPHGFSQCALFLRDVVQS